MKLLALAAFLAALTCAMPAQAAEVLVMLRMPAPHVQANAGYQGAYGDEAGRRARVRIADKLAERYGLSVVTEWPMPRLGVHCFVMDGADDARVDEIAAKLNAEANVSWSEPMHVYQGQATVGADPLFQAQPAATAWRLSELHRTVTGRNVRVAVIDSAIDAAHPDLAGQVDTTRNFVAKPSPPGGEAHGTGVAGVIAAHEGNGAGIAGVAPGARLLGLRACAQTGAATACDSLSIARALDFALERGVQVVNLSFSGPPDILMSRLIDIALARGMFVVAAYDKAQTKGGFPASYPGVIAVNDVATAGAVQAPGRDIPTTEPGGRYGVVNGSSFAAAHVSGLLALVRERDRRTRGIATLVITGPAGTIDACATVLKTPAPQCGQPKDVLAGR